MKDKIENLILIHDKYLLNDSLKKNLKKIKFDYDVKYENFNDVYAICKKILAKEYLEIYHRIVIIDKHGIAPYLYFTKIHKVVAAVTYDEYSAYMTAFHNNAKVLIVGYAISGEKLIEKMIYKYLQKPYEGGRHAVREDMLNLETSVGEKK